MKLFHAGAAPGEGGSELSRLRRCRRGHGRLRSEIPVYAQLFSHY